MKMTPQLFSEYWKEIVTCKPDYKLMITIREDGNWVVEITCQPEGYMSRLIETTLEVAMLESLHMINDDDFNLNLELFICDDEVLLESDYPPHDVVQSMLALVGVFMTTDEVKLLNVHQRIDSIDWAGAVHLKASDNDVDVPVMPDFLPDVDFSKQGDGGDIFGMPE